MFILGPTQYVLHIRFPNALNRQRNTIILKPSYQAGLSPTCHRPMPKPFRNRVPHHWPP